VTTSLGALRAHPTELPLTQCQSARDNGADIDVRIVGALPNRLNGFIARSCHAVDRVILASDGDDDSARPLAAQPAPRRLERPAITVACRISMPSRDCSGKRAETTTKPSTKWATTATTTAMVDRILSPSSRGLHSRKTPWQRVKAYIERKPLDRRAIRPT
jgi:hypothetical protein